MKLQRRKASLLFLWFLVCALPVYSADHGSDNYAESLRKISTGVFDLRALLPKTIQAAVTVYEERDGKITPQLNLAPEGQKAQKELSQLLEGTPIVESAHDALDFPISMTVINRRTGKKTNKTLDALGALVWFAASAPKRDDFGGRRLFLKDRGQVITSIVATTGKTDLDSLKAIIQTSFKGLATLPNGPFLLSYQLRDGEPAQNSFLWNPSKKAFELQGNPAHGTWLAQEDAKKILSHVDMMEALAWAKARSPLSTHERVGELLGRPEVHALVSKAGGDERALRKALVSAVTKYLDWSPSPNKRQNFTVVKKKIDTKTGVVPRAEPDVVRVAVIYPDENKDERVATARSIGAFAYVGKKTQDAIGAVEKHFAETGKLVELFLVAHGCAQGNDLANEGSKAVKEFIARARGKVKRVYVIGCLVAQEAGNTNQPHVLHDLATGLQVPAVAVDQLVGSGMRNWVLYADGNVVTVIPNAIETPAPIAFLDNKKLWN